MDTLQLRDFDQLRCLAREAALPYGSLTRCVRSASAIVRESLWFACAEAAERVAEQLREERADDRMPPDQIAAIIGERTAWRDIEGRDLREALVEGLAQRLLDSLAELHERMAITPCVSPSN